MNNLSVGDTIESKKISKILYIFKILWEGWEMDNTGWVVEFEDGKKAIIATNHGRPFITKTDRIFQKISEYKNAIRETEEALKMLRTDKCESEI